jgi:hypothetical protein
LRLINENNALTAEQEQNGNNPRLDYEIAAKNTEIRIQRDGMWDIDVLNNLELAPNPDVFLETLLGTVKGHVISYQTWHKKLETEKRVRLTKQFLNLKGIYIENADQIAAIEQELNLAVQKKIEERVKNKNKSSNA